MPSRFRKRYAPTGLQSHPIKFGKGLYLTTPPVAGDPYLGSSDAPPDAAQYAYNLYPDSTSRLIMRGPVKKSIIDTVQGNNLGSVTAWYDTPAAGVTPEPTYTPLATFEIQLWAPAAGGSGGTGGIQPRIATKGSYNGTYTLVLARKSLVFGAGPPVTVDVSHAAELYGSDEGLTSISAYASDTVSQRYEIGQFSSAGQLGAEEGYATHWAIAALNDSLWLSPGVYAPSKVVIDGTGNRVVSPWANAPSGCQILVVWKGRIIATRRTATPKRVFYSDIGNPESPAVANWGNNFIDIKGGGEERGGETLNAAVVGANLLIFSTEGITVIRDSNTFANQLISHQLIFDPIQALKAMSVYASNTYGMPMYCRPRDVLATLADKCYFFGQRGGLYVTDGVTVRRIDEGRYDGFFSEDNLRPPRWRIVADNGNNCLYFVSNEKGHAGNIYKDGHFVHVYDLKLDIFYAVRFNTDPEGIYNLFHRPSDGKRMFWARKATTGYWELVEWSTDRAFNATAADYDPATPGTPVLYNGEWLTGWEDLGSVENYERVRRIAGIVHGTLETTTYKDFDATVGVAGTMVGGDTRPSYVHTHPESRGRAHAVRFKAVGKRSQLYAADYLTRGGREH